MMAERSRILIVDDAPENILVMQKILGDFLLFAATSGQRALDWLASNETDLILLDMSMPGMDGLAVLASLQENGATRDIPVLFVTVDDSSSTESAALRAGAVDFIAKPVNPDVLRSRVRTHISLAAQRKALQMANENLERQVEKRTLELLHAKDEAEAANHAKTLFLGNMSHEFRTPLHQIMGVSQLLRKQPLNERGGQQLDMLAGAVGRLETMVQGILELVALEAKTATVNYQPLDPGQMVEAMLSIVRPGASEKGLSLSLEIDPRLPADLQGDRTHFNTMLACYVNNAIRFAQRGAIRIRLVKEAETLSTCRLRLEVEDEGPGIAPEAMARIFNHFEQADNTHTRQFGGTGVGLAIVRKLAHLMHGDAGCRSELGKGSTFWASMELKRPTAGHDFQI